MLEQFFTEYKKALNSNNDLYNFVKRKSIKESNNNQVFQGIGSQCREVSIFCKEMLDKIKNKDVKDIHINSSSNNSDDLKVSIVFNKNGKEFHLDNNLINNIKTDVTELLKEELLKLKDELKNILDTDISEPDYTNNINIILYHIILFYYNTNYKFFYDALLSIKLLLETLVTNNGKTIDDNIKESILNINDIYKRTEDFYKKQIISMLKKANEKTHIESKKLCNDFIIQWENINNNNLEKTNLEEIKDLFNNNKFINKIKELSESHKKNNSSNSNTANSNNTSNATTVFNNTASNNSTNSSTSNNNTSNTAVVSNNAASNNSSNSSSVNNNNSNSNQDKFARESNDEIETLDNDKIKNTNLPTPLIQLKKHGLKYDESALTKRDKVVINIIYNKIHGNRDGVEKLTTSGNRKYSNSYFDDENESKSFCLNLKLKRLLEAKPVPRAQGKTTNNVPQTKGNRLSAVPPTASKNRSSAVPTTTSKGSNSQQNTQGNVPLSQRTQTNAVPSAKGKQTSSVPSAKGNRTSAVPTASKSRTQDVARAVGRQTIAPQKTYQDQNDNNNGNNGNNGNIDKPLVLKNLRYEINIMSPLARCLIIFLIANEIMPQYQYLSSKNKKLAIRQVTGAKKNAKGKNKTKEGDKEALQQDSLVLQKIDFKDGKGKEYKILYKDDIHKQKAVFVIQPNTSSGSKTEHDIGRCWFKGDVVTDVSEDRDNGFKSNMMKVTHVSSGEHSIYKFVDYYMKNDQIPSKSGGLLDKVRDWTLKR